MSASIRKKKVLSSFQEIAKNEEKDPLFPNGDKMDINGLEMPAEVF